jgi:hypothetical protein
VLFDYAQHAGATPEGDIARELVVVRHGQRVFDEIVESYLKKVTYADDGWAQRIRLPQYQRAEVLADPRFSYGQPTFLEMFWAGDDLASVAAEYGVPEDQMEDVVRVASRRAA